MIEINPTQAAMIGDDLKRLREKWQAEVPKLTLAGWIEQIGAYGHKYLKAESGEINQPPDGEDCTSHPDFNVLFDGPRLRDHREMDLRGKILSILFIGACIPNFQLAVTATDSILRAMEVAHDRLRTP